MPHSTHQQSASSPAERRRLRVPADDGGVLIEPPPSEAESVIRTNKIRLSAIHDVEMQGRTLGHMREQARSELVASAFRYTSEVRPHASFPDKPSSIILTGHQPELFHPGVWVKNFVAADIAKRTGGIAINLIVDNDNCESASVRVPVQTENGIRFDRITIDEPQPSQPWEERQVVSRDQLASFGDRVSKKLAPFGIKNPIASQLAFSEPRKRLADTLTAARVELESERGVENLELPVSRLCQSESFLRFLCHMLVNIEHFHEVHNRVLVEYRQRNNLRSKTHPVPALEPQDGWWEAPFWSWREGEHVRNRLFAKQLSPKVLAISDGTRVLAELPVGPGMDACCAVEVLMQLASAGERIRTRALTTTIFSRLLFGDLFIHGIGGAKYDEMTDEILREFYGVEPPEFMTVSATLRLLGDRASNVELQDIENLQVRDRNLKFNAQDELANSQDDFVRELVAEKQRLIAEQQRFDGTNPGGNHQRYHRFREINKQLAKHTVVEREAIEKEIETLRIELHQNELLQSRDMSFCLFPLERLDAVIG
ncbi:MAG: hypothetical protein AB8G99_05395 [Planctomycetaceae bacterium]